MWLAVRCRLAKKESRRRMALGRHLRHLPASEAAWLSGELTSHQVAAIGACRRPGREAALARDEAMLVEQARKLRCDEFQRICAYWAQLNDPEGTEKDAEDLRAERGAWLDQSFSGLFFGRTTLDPIGGTIVSDELRRLEQGLFEADWAEAKARLEREPTLDELPRSPAQRRADALVEMAIRSRTAPAHGRRPAPLFSVLVGYETLRGPICQLAQGAVVTPGSLVRWLDEAVIERAVFAPGKRIEVSERARLFSGATQRAIQLRDGGCVHPFCDRPVGECQVDHILPYSQGGRTTQENGRLMCGFHNRLRNQRPPPRPRE
jgi:hypothetical protein